MKRMRSWWLAAAACAVLAAALLLPQRFLQQKLDRVAETEFSVDGAELDTLHHRGEFLFKTHAWESSCY